MPFVLERYPNAHAVIVGGKHELEPDYSDYLSSRIESLGLNNQVTLAGYQADIPHWMQAMDIVVHASDREPFGMVIIEAMALGKPVVAGAGGGPTEIISEGTNGLLAKYGNPQQLAGQILRYLDHPAWTKSVGEAARQHARDFSTERFSKCLTDAVLALPSAASNDSAYYAPQP
jgi:glycosyltransferase involved in cell wall biosynthesis